MNRLPQLKEQALNRWPSILVALGIDEKLLNYKKNHPCPVPGCGGTNRFRYTGTPNGHWICSQCSPPSAAGDGVTLLQAVYGWDFAETARQVRSVLGETETVMIVDDTEERKAKADEIWAETVLMTNRDATHIYLLYRGLKGLPWAELCSIRTHPNLHGHPAMVARVATGAVHVTYLAPDGRGKAPVSPSRRRFGVAPRGGSAMLLPTPENGTALVAEGIETSLALWLDWGLSTSEVGCFAALDANGLENVELKSSCIVIGGDNDDNFVGQHAAYSAARRLSLAGKSVAVTIPPHRGDWLDILNMKKEKKRYNP